MKSHILVVFFLIITSLCHAQDNGLVLGGLKITIGMGKKELLEKIHVNYELKQIKGIGDDAWGVWEKGKYGILPFEGLVTFENELVKWASKSWGTFRGEESIKSGVELFSVLSNIIGSNEVPASITTSTTRVPMLVFQSINIKIGNKKIIILISDSSDPEKGVGKSISIDEQLSLSGHAK